MPTARAWLPFVLAPWSVSCEIRFHGELAIVRDWGDVQKGLRAEFPKLYVQGAVAGVPPLLQPVQLTSDDEARSVLLAVNLYRVINQPRTTPRPSRAGLLPSFKALRRSAHQSPDEIWVGRRQLRRHAWDARRFDPADLSTSARGCRASRSRPDSRFRGQPSFTIEVPRARGLRVRVSLSQPSVTLSMNPASGMPPTVVQGTPFDLDCHFSENSHGSSDQIARFVDDAHDVLDDLFFGLITDEYLFATSGPARKPDALERCLSSCRRHAATAACPSESGLHRR